MTKAKKKDKTSDVVTMKLKDIKVDKELIDLRPVNGSTVSRYKRAMRFDGVEGFPLMILDKKTKRIVSGNQRYAAMFSEYGQDFKVDVMLRSYGSRLELVEHAVTENMKFGRELEGFEAKRFRKRLYELNSPVERIAKLFNKTVRATKRELSGFTVITVGKKPKFKQKKITVKSKTDDGIEVERREPVKGSIPAFVVKRGMTEKQWEEHRDKDIGVVAPQLADQLIRHLKNDYLDPSYTGKMRELYAVLGEWLEKQEPDS